MPPSLESLAQDVRDALRLLVRRPVFTLASMAALVVGVGAATLAYSLATALLLRPLPVERPDELVYLDSPSFSYPILREVRTRSAFLTDAFGWTLEQYDTDWNGAERAFARAARDRERVSAAGREPGHRSRAERGRRRPGRSAGGRAELCDLAAAVWRRRRGPRTDRARARRANHDRRRHATRILRRRARPSARDHRAGWTCPAPFTIRRRRAGATRPRLVAHHGSPAARGVARSGERAISGRVDAGARGGGRSARHAGAARALPVAAERPRRRPRRVLVGAESVPATTPHPGWVDGALVAGRVRHRRESARRRRVGPLAGAGDAPRAGMRPGATGEAGADRRSGAGGAGCGRCGLDGAMERARAHRAARDEHRSRGARFRLRLAALGLPCRHRRRQRARLQRRADGARLAPRPRPNRSRPARER